MRATDEKGPEETVYPLIFRFQDLVYGEGFVAGVAYYGRVLAEKESEGGKWWWHGVQPGGVSAAGDSLDAAHLAFRKALKEVFVDIASDGCAFEAFERNVRGFFEDEDREDRGRWDAAVKRCKQSAPKDPAIAALRREHAEAECWIDIQRLDVTADKSRPSFSRENIVDEVVLPAAA